MTKFFKHLFLTLGITVLFSGCSIWGFSFNFNFWGDEEDTKKELVIPENSPTWLKDISKKSFFSSLGVASRLEKDKPEFQNKRALINASNNILKNIYQKSYLVFKEYEEEFDIQTSYNKDLKNLSQDIALKSLKKAKRTNFFISKDKTLFLEITLDEKIVLEYIQNGAKTLYKDNKNLNNFFFSEKGKEKILENLKK